MSFYTDFKSHALGRGYDIDGAYGAQCWDGFAQYCRELGVPYANCTVSGYAKDIWEQRHNNGMLKYFDEVVDLEPGDIVVFREDPNWTPVSHIAMFDSDIDGVYGWFLGQNQGGASYPGGGGVFNLARLPYSATYATAFRLKGSASKPAEKKASGGAIDHNGETYSALTTNFNPNVMYSNASAGVSGYDRMAIDRIVIHHNATTNKNVAMQTWYESSGNWTSAHYEIADNEIWGCVGENYVAFHAGDATMNRRSIGLEHVNNAGAPNWTISEATYQTSAKLIADIAKRYNIPIDAQHIIPHKQVSATACPAGIDVARLISMAQAVASGGAPKSEPVKNGEYRVKTSEVMNVRSTPSLKGAVKSTAKAGVYTIVETKTADGYDWGKLKSGAGWIALKWAKRL